MPLPAGGTEPWPPPAFEHAFNQISLWSAWYAGNTDELCRIYGAEDGYSFDSTSQARMRNYSSQYRGGIVGKLARWFLGEPIPQGERRAKLHIPLAGDIASKSSRLLFAEPPVFKLEDSGTKDRLDELVDDSVHATLLEAGEVCSALGGTYLRVVWDQELRDRPWLDAVQADSAVPEWRYGLLTAVTFWRVLLNDGKRVMRHLERHERGRILHGLYEGTTEHLGKEVPLAQHSETEALEAEVVTGLKDLLTAVYVPNIKPNRLWLDNPVAAHLGRSDFQGIEPELDALDEVWSSLLRDIRLAKGRVIVPSVYLETLGAGKGARFDAEREIYAALNMLPDQGGQQLTVQQFAIRAEEHLRVAEELTRVIVRGAGHSAQSFGMKDDGQAVTATEVRAELSDSFLTRTHKILYWRPAVAEILETLLAVDAAVFNTKVTPQRPDIEWPDGVAEDPETTARTLQLLHAAEAVSIETRVRRANPDWDDPAVAEEVARIKDETSITVQDPGTFNGDPPEKAPEDAPDDEQDEPQE